MSNQKKTYAEAMNECLANTNEIINQTKEREEKLAITTAKDVLARLNQLEDKQRCLRVRILDWLSDNCHALGNKFHEMSVKIDSPCAIKLPKTVD